MPDPIYNPNNIVRKEKVNSNSDIPEYNPNNIVKKEVVDTRTFDRDSNVELPKYTTPQEIEADSAINFLKEKGGRNGSTVLDSEWDVLKDVLKDPRATKEQREKAILTIQGYDAKHDDNNTMYYNKREENGVYVPTALAYGENPPKGYKVASVWGNQKDAEDDSWYTDLGKSLGNGVLGAAQGVVDLAQVGTTLVTGEESKYLNKLGNTAEALKFKKDSELDTPMFDSEGITKWSDLLDKDRFDLSPKALWGSFNMAAESLASFYGGTKGAVTVAKSGKGFAQGLKGIGKEFIDDAGVVQNAINLGGNATKATIFAGSFATQLGDNLDSAEEAGLTGRDKAAVASAITAPMAALDAFWGLDGKLMSTIFQNEKRTLLKNVIKSVEKDAAGNITANGFKQLTKQMTVGYSELAKKGVKEVVKDAVSEGTQEAAQDFSQKAGEQLWDKMTPDERGQFGTDAFSAKSFGDYINSFATSTGPGGGMSIATQVLRNKHNEQSINAYERVKQGPEAVKALKADLSANLKSGDINQSEYEQAIFKIDSYEKYHQETKDVNLKPEDEKKAFELSFQIQGIKTEIPTNENEISKLDPIARAKVESKQKQAKELQSELNDIIRQGEIKGEPVIPKKEEERIKKEKEKEIKAEETLKKEKEINSKLNQKKSAKEPNPDYPIEPKVEAKPEKAWITDKRTYEEIPAEEWNHSKTDERLLHKAARKYISEQPGQEVNGQLYLHLYEYNGTKNRTIRVKLEDGKILKLGSSKIVDDSGLSGYFHTERLKGNLTNEPVGVKVVELAPDENGVKKKVIKIYQKSSGKYLAYVKETHTGQKKATDKNGNPLYTEEQISGELEDLKLQDEKPLPPEEVERLRNTPIVPIIPKTPTEKAKVATDKIVEDAKVKVKNQSLNKRRLEIFELFKDRKKLSNNEESELNKELENILLELSENKSKEKKESKTTLKDEEQVAKLRADEKAEYAAMPNPNDEVARQKIYDAYDKLITPLLNKIKEAKVSIPLTITKAVRQQLLDLGYSKVNVDNMKPERALDIINKQETNKKEDGSENRPSDVVEKDINPKEKVKPNLPTASKDFGVTEVIPYDAPERNKYQPKNQLRFGQGAYYEAVWLVGDEDLIELIQSGSRIKKNFTLSTSAKKPVAMDRVKKLESIVGMTAIDAHDRAKELAKENRDKNEERIIILGEPKKLIINEDGAENEIANGKVNGEDNVEQEPIIAAIKRKARSNKKAELAEAAREANDLIEKATDVINMPISEISTDEKRFQNRDELDKDIVKSISENFDENQFDPIVVWKDGDKTFVLAGHHRFEGAKLAGKKSVKVRYFEGEESKAVEFAREKSNANRTLENPVERAKIYRDKLARGESKKSVEEQAKQNEGKNASFYLNIAALNHDGMAISTYNSFKTSEDKSTQKEVEKILDWIGDIRRSYSELTNEHEQELFNFLFKGDAKRITTKSEFKQKVSSIVGTLDFDYLKPLNISRFKNITEGENVYNSEVNSLKNKIDEKQKEINLINDRFVNPKNDKYVNPSDKDYKNIKKLADEKSAKLNKEQKDLNLKLLQLYQDKGKYLNAGSNQGELFQKVSQRKGDFSKVLKSIQNAFEGINVEVNADKFKGEQSTVAGKVSADGKFIYINPNYAGLDTPIHEAGHILIDAMGYNNRIIQAAIKQLRTTPLYAETKERYKELSEQELDKEVLAEAIGREGADIFDKAEDRSKFKAYLDYIFDWLKQKLGLDKNIAKSLAKQIIGGVKTKNLEGTNTGKEQLQKTDKDKKKNPIGVKALSFAQYATEQGFSYEKETDKIDEAKVLLQEARDAEQEALVNGTQEEHDAAKEELRLARKAYSIAGKRSFEYKQYKNDFYAIQDILKQNDLENYTTEELQDLISKIHGFDNKAAKAVKEDAMLRLAYVVRKKQQEFLKEKNDSYIESVADTKDIGAIDKHLLHISHFTEHQPEMQAASKAIGNAFMDKITDANTRKDTHEKLAVKIIKEENKRLGITGSAANRFSSDSVKYFDWMENPEGKEIKDKETGEVIGYEPALLTIDEAQKMGLSEAKINYLKFTRETIADFKDELVNNDFENAVMDSIKVDKGFMEAFKSEGFITAFSYYLGGGGANLGQVRIMHNGTPMSYAEIEKEIISKVKKNDIVGTIKALFELLVANVSARRQLKRGFNVDEKENPLQVKGMAEYSLNNKGQLVSKFDKPRTKDRGYSKDFYRAMNQFIDESAHVKHMSKVMPLVESVEYLNKSGYMEKGIKAKPHVEEWIKQWKALHIFKEPYVNDPVLDASIKYLRKLVASTTMWFNIPANAINVAVGNYNSWRQENGAVLAKGNARLFGGKGERAVFGVVNQYALDIIKKYNIVNQDYDSQPIIKANTIFSRIATIGTQVGEYQIQGSLGLGLMTEEEFNSFEYTKDKYGNEILTVKPNSKITEEDLKAKMVAIKNRVTDIQGKYPDEDRRNIMRGEIGKAAFQFKVWIPDWVKERFSAKYINANGIEKEGTIRALYGEGFKQIKKQIKEDGLKKALWNSDTKESKNFRSNIKGLLTIGTLMSLSFRDDDDDEVRGKMSVLDNLIGQVLFILDPEQAKYTVSNPVAALGKVKDLINAVESVVKLDDNMYKKIKRVAPGNKTLDIAESVSKLVTK